MTLTPGEVVSLREHIEELLDICQHTQRDRLQAWIDAHDEKHRLEAQAIERARENVDTWRLNANEWRSTLQDERIQQVSRDTYDAKMKAIDDRLHKIELDLDRVTTRMATIGGAIAFGLVLFQILLKFLVP